MNEGILKRYAPLFLRIGMAIIFLWFSFSQLADPEIWMGMIPSYAESIAHPLTLVYVNAVFELVFAFLLLLGFKTRFVSGLLTLHLFHIVTILDYGPTGARDFALAIASLSIFMNGPDEFCLDKILKKKENSSVPIINN